MSKLQTVKPRLRLLDSNRVKPVQASKRPTGNSLYALMRSYSLNHPRICAECKRQGLVAYGDELDHITPLHFGGHPTAEANLAWLCREHHLEKSALEAKIRAS